MKEAVRSGRRANFYITENSFIDHYAREVGTTGIAVYHTLARYANCETRSTWVGTARVADLLGVDQRTVQRALKKLEGLNLIRIIRSSNMTTYFLVPVPSRPKTSTVIPLFDQISDQELSLNRIDEDDDAAPMSHPTSPLSQLPTFTPSATTEPPRFAASRSHTSDTSVTVYKEEQNLLDKTSGQESKPSPALQKSVRQIIAMLGMPVTDSNCKMIEAALIAETDYSGQSLPEAAELLAKAAISDRDRGVPINKFYFEDAKWRHSRATGGNNGRLSRAEQRKLDNLEVNARVKQRFRDLLGTP